MGISTTTWRPTRSPTDGTITTRLAWPTTLHATAATARDGPSLSESALAIVPIIEGASTTAPSTIHSPTLPAGAICSAIRARTSVRGTTATGMAMGSLPTAWLSIVMIRGGVRRSALATHRRIAPGSVHPWLTGIGMPPRIGERPIAATGLRRVTGRGRDHPSCARLPVRERVRHRDSESRTASTWERGPLESALARCGVRSHRASASPAATNR